MRSASLKGKLPESCRLGWRMGITLALAGRAPSKRSDTPDCVRFSGFRPCRIGIAVTCAQKFILLYFRGLLGAPEADWSWAVYNCLSSSHTTKIIMFKRWFSRVFLVVPQSPMSRSRSAL